MAAALVAAPGDEDMADAERGLQAAIAVIRQVAEGAALDDVLSGIAEQSTRVIGGGSASVLLLGPDGSLRLGAAYELRPAYAEWLASPFIASGHGMAGRALRAKEHILLEDVDTDPWMLRPEAAEMRRFVREEGYRSMLAVPLIIGSEAVGSLQVYRRTSGRWHPPEVALVASFAQHAANAILTARLIQAQRTQVEAMSRLVRVLREQTHEYANRIHTIDGLLALGEGQELTRFVGGLVERHKRVHGAVADTITHPVVQGLVLAEMNAAAQRGIALRLGGGSRFDCMPRGLTDADAVTIIGNLLQNAFDAVADVEVDRRRVELTLTSGAAGSVIEVRDWGVGVDARVDILADGVSSKPAHPGIGLGLVERALAPAGGTLRYVPHPEGVSFIASIPGVRHEC